MMKLCLKNSFTENSPIKPRLYSRVQLLLHFNLIDVYITQNIFLQDESYFSQIKLPTQVTKFIVKQIFICCLNCHWFFIKFDKNSGCVPNLARFPRSVSDINVNVSAKTICVKLMRFSYSAGVLCSFDLRIMEEYVMSYTYLLIVLDHHFLNQQATQ